MWRYLRLALMCLLALALPVQGTAAATLIACGPGHARLAGPWERSAHAHGDASAPHGEDAVPAHPGASEASHPPATSSGDTAQLDRLSKVSCSACAACCASAALPSAAPAFAPLRFDAGYSSTVPLRLAAFLTGGPDRPPRHVLA
ncbi:hypothetical protein [Eleftheria terrae]|uniref:hypothetical protein n=1 Tax=Eleftheria terrae TaxID=1597781 RepID=UPI00263BB434|nr:hypothetical protein [Eleftheria terrae]WKB54004.1 hypothetical protein N7L95_06340 [Eleftheria terrae]